ncbi:hypothetical protein DES36_1093 [Alkalibaculum bacchi]|uniref:Uncharacterized protein n=1 Tax=Alkalibaculum bacchi TaxID=645887 RepID=A0A366I7I6_9FIRM|nr:hypothetical protein [Alkalibaculum bacchi]RBP63789.1 hypothetical protein DES36_1093 [Alkalibaculum bacchi]
MKAILLGTFAQFIIFILSLILENHEIIKRGNVFLFMCALVLAQGIGAGGGGWEYVGFNEDEQNKVRDHRGNIGLKFLFFIIPCLIVMTLYFYIY